MRLTESARKRLHSQESRIVEYTPDGVGMTGVEAFCFGAAQANSIHIKEVDSFDFPDDSIFDMSPTPESVLSNIGAARDAMDDSEISDLFPRFDDVSEPLGSFFSAYLVNMAFRVMDSSGLEEVSSHALPLPALPAEVVSTLAPLGEIHGSLGTARFSDSHSIVKALVWASLNCTDGPSAMDAVSRLWLPTVQTGGHSDHILSVRFSEYFRNRGVEIGVDDFRGHFFSGLWPKSLPDAIGCLPEAYKEAFPKLFWSYKDAPHFHKFVGSREVRSLLLEVGLKWKSPSPTHLCFNRSLRDLTVLAEEDWLYRMPKGPGADKTARDLGLFSRDGHPSQLFSRCYHGKVVLRGPEKFFDPEALACAAGTGCGHVVSGRGLKSYTSFFFNSLRQEEVLYHNPFYGDEVLSSNQEVL